MIIDFIVRVHEYGLYKCTKCRILIVQSNMYNKKSTFIFVVIFNLTRIRYIYKKKKNTVRTTASVV